MTQPSQPKRGEMDEDPGKIAEACIGLRGGALALWADKASFLLKLAAEEIAKTKIAHPAFWQQMEKHAEQLFDDTYE